MAERQAAVEDMVGSAAPDPGFWAGRKILLTGHSGFKGAWSALWLHRLGAEVHGLALAPDTQPSLWREAGAKVLASETLCDIADAAAVRRAVATVQPELVLHMAAQALVRRSFADPLGTIATNTIGTANLLDALRPLDGIKAALIVTTDKVYANAGAARDFVEDDRLGGHDPYSASKAAAELVTQCYAASFLAPRGVQVATARAGNVVGGGDWSEDRLVPDLWRAARDGVPLALRSPGATRPWQHVLEPLAGYFLYLERLAGGAELPSALNFGPLPGTPISVAEVAEAIAATLGVAHGWRQDEGVHPPEMQWLSIDPALAGDTLGWRPRLDAHETIAWTARWYEAHRGGTAARALCLNQINDYEKILTA